MDNSTNTHALISTEAGGKNIKVTAIGSEGAVLALHAAELDKAPRGLFLSGRELDHDLTRQAVRAMADRLTPTQRRALADLERDRRKYGRRSVRPGYAANSWRGMESVELSQVTKSPKMADLLHVEGVPYGPKTYTLKAVGRLVAAVIIESMPTFRIDYTTPRPPRVVGP